MSALLAVLAAGLLVAVILGALYGVLDFYIPIIYLNIIMTVGVGAGVGYTLYRAARALRIRNPGLVLVLGAVCGLVADYVAFVTWLLPVFDWQVLLWHPVWVARALSAVAEIGVWGLSKGSTVSGGFLYTVWGVELLIIVGMAALLPYSFLRAMAYCEDCRQWVEDKTPVMPFEAITDAKAFRKSLEQGEFGVLGSIKPVAAEEPNYAYLELSRCRGCDNLHLLTVRNVKTTFDKAGKATKNEEAVVENLLIDAESRELVLQLAPTSANSAVPAASAAAAEETEPTAAPAAEQAPPVSPP